MDQEILDNFQAVVHELFIRWEALKLAVEHTERHDGQQAARTLRDDIFKYCINYDVEPEDLEEELSDKIDEIFNTICEDNSTKELSRLLLNYLKLCLESKFDEVRHHIGQLPNCVNWLDPSFKITPAPRDDSDSDSDSGSDEDMEMGSDDEAPPLAESSQRQRNKPQTDEDGWTTIPSRRR